MKLDLRPRQGLPGLLGMKEPILSLIVTLIFSIIIVIAVTVILLL